MKKKTLAWAKKLHNLYLCGMSLSKLAKNYGDGVSRQSIHYYFKRFNLETRAIKNRHSVEYGGYRYSEDNNGYLRKTNGKRELLHRSVWIDAFGPIEDDFDIRHIDGNRKNNCIENLEKISRSEHTRKYSVFNNQYTKGKKERTMAQRKNCKRCGKDITHNKRMSPSRIAKAEYCSKLCSIEQLKKDGRGIGNQRRELARAKKFITLICASKMANR